MGKPVTVTDFANWLCERAAFYENAAQLSITRGAADSVQHYKGMREGLLMAARACRQANIRPAENETFTLESADQLALPLGATVRKLVPGAPAPRDRVSGGVS